MNVAIYGPHGSSWALHEQTIGADARSDDALALGASSMRWERDDLVVDIDERTSPWRRPLRCRMVLHPEAPSLGAYELDRSGLHKWWPVAPHCRVDVEIRDPAVRFQGAGYHDVNAGSVPLEATFSDWTWSRARLSPSRTAIAYDVRSADGAEIGYSLDVDARKGVTTMQDLVMAPLPSTAWRMDRRIRIDPGSPAGLARPLEDTPFYARALVRSRIGGLEATAMHETLSLRRMKRRWVQFLMQFRMDTE